MKCTNSYPEHCGAFHAPYNNTSRYPAMKSSLIGIAAVALLFAAPQFVRAQAKVVGLNVYPPNVNLNTKLDRQRFIVVAKREDGVTLDVTKQATAKLADPSFARLEPGL